MDTQTATFPHLFFKQVNDRQQQIALRRKNYGIWNRISWQQYGQMVQEAAAALISIGLEPGDR
ncbi:MAG: long-chain fatty acid--CoA ligase, partial [Desulfobacterales bacterium]